MMITDIDRALAEVETLHPRASLVYARILLTLAARARANQSMSQADLGELIGRGRDATSVQDACAVLEEIGAIEREDGDGSNPRAKIVRLKPSGGNDE